MTIKRLDITIEVLFTKLSLESYCTELINSLGVQSYFPQGCAGGKGSLDSILDEGTVAKINSSNTGGV
jgi:hypothetical protein